MASDWEISKTTGKCTATHREFAEGEAYFAALFATPEGFERRDYATEAWTGPPPGCFCYWQGRVPVREKNPKSLAINREMLTGLFLRLQDEESEAKQRFRFVLALLLMRKRLLKFEQKVSDGQRESWQLRLRSDQSVHEVLNPQLTDEEVDRLGAQVTAILGGEADAIASLDEVDWEGREGQEGERAREGEGETGQDRETEGRSDGETEGGGA